MEFRKVHVLGHMKVLRMFLNQILPLSLRRGLNMDLNSKQSREQSFQGIMQSLCSKISHYHDSNTVLGQFIAAHTVLTEVERDAIYLSSRNFLLDIL